jgi:molybdopterin synthase catalytic subunit
MRVGEIWSTEASKVVAKAGKVEEDCAFETLSKVVERTKEQYCVYGGAS